MDEHLAASARPDPPDQASDPAPQTVPSSPWAQPDAVEYGPPAPPAGLVDLPRFQWQPVPPSNTPTWPPVVAAPQQQNSPLAIGAVIGLVVTLVMAVAMISQLDNKVVGTAVAATSLTVPAPPRPVPPESSAPTPSTPSPVRPVLQLETNPLLVPGSALPPVTCQLPELGRAPEQLRAFYTAGIKCLADAWTPVLEQLNLPHTVPALEISATAVSKCRSSSESEHVVASYCPPEKMIYMKLDRMLQVFRTSREGHLVVLAHEYGHHVQSLSGIASAALQRQLRLEEDSPQWLDLVRRKELQAECFAGMFIASVAGRGSVTKAMGTTALGVFKSTGDSTTHGTRKNRDRWGTAGGKNNNTRSCNTWTAPAEEVG